MKTSKYQHVAYIVPIQCIEYINVREAMAESIHNKRELDEMGREREREREMRGSKQLCPNQMHLRMDGYNVHDIE